MNKNEERLKQTIIRLPESLYFELKEYSDKIGMPINEFVKRAIRDKLIEKTDDERIKALEEKVEAMEIYIKATKSKEEAP